MFDWIGDALGWVGDKISGAVSSVGSAISEAVWDIMLEWLFKTIYGAVADFFGMINSMAAEIFELNWVNAFLSLFSSFGWALFAAGLAVAVFDTAARMPGAKISYALNQRLPENIRVRKSQEVASDFHPRHCESRKTYEYRILNAEFPIPTKRLYAYFTYVPLNADRMQEAAAYLVGEHDFKSFCSAGSQAESTIRTIYSAEVQRKDDEIIIRVTGNGFLYNMVRIIAGTLMEAGKGAREPEYMMNILAAKDRSAAGPTAPACGLMLTRYLFL